MLFFVKGEIWLYKHHQPCVDFLPKTFTSLILGKDVYYNCKLLGFWEIHTKTCDFCIRFGCLPKRVFYETVRWFAFVSAPPHVKGHTILAAQPLEGKCPQEMNKEILSGLGTALQEVAEAIRKCYDPAPKDILFASLRGDITHFHIHLVPLWPEDEQCWRRVTGYKKHHLMEFLGTLEKRHNFLLLECEAKERKDEETQRRESTLQMAPEIQKLRDITGYRPKA